MNTEEILNTITSIQQIDLEELKVKIQQDQPFDVKPIIEKLELIGTRPDDR